MPCRDWEGVSDTYSGSDYRDVSNRLDKLTRMLCEVMTHCCGNGIVDPAVFSKETQQWWTKHQEDDRIRRAAEASKKKRDAEEKERRRKRREMINNMTPEERKILGLSKE